jgi:serine/threonine protein kinase
MGMDEKSSVGNGGAFGRVYIICLPSGELVAVKKLVNIGNQSPKALKAEVKTLAKIRHKNITKVLGFCHSEESIFLIYEYLQKGSLGDLISRPDFQLQWSDRLKIAIGVAQGLAYLHKHYVPHLLHRNVKSTNILLDADFEPKLTDFALDRIVGEAAFQTTIASESAYSCYNAPGMILSLIVSILYLQKSDCSFGVYNSASQNHIASVLRIVLSPFIDCRMWIHEESNRANGCLQLWCGATRAHSRPTS